MKKITLLTICVFSLAPGLSIAQSAQAYLGGSYEHGNVKIGSHNTNMDGIKFQAAAEQDWGNIKGTAATLSNHDADYDNYTLAIEKPFNIQQSNFFIAPEVGATYSRYKDNHYNESDFGPMLGASVGYNINTNFQLISNYNHSFGMKSSQDNIDEDSMSIGLNYRFK
ncbi:outer membrane beta-barrel protein [Aliivibrio finisterrensis]|uniref:Porin family protein n=1 Tax=Aliivibrio finisterrensis TaxID=511998 RepID=A0A6N6RNN7_9GAMM|nr:outer membrane beta-barrel protein [Aliivibrio finisterrensis]KAB2823053.1 porin family protein [Aliivibrio finisterrensis]